MLSVISVLGLMIMRLALPLALLIAMGTYLSRWDRMSR
jgi:hypothetical protein